jgi:hypothetical protein
MIIAHHLGGSGDTLEVLQAVLDTNFWLATHVTTMTLGYTATLVAGFFAMALNFRMQSQHCFFTRFHSFLLPHFEPIEGREGAPVGGIESARHGGRPKTIHRTGRWLARFAAGNLRRLKRSCHGAAQVSALRSKSSVEASKVVRELSDGFLRPRPRRFA